MCRSNPNQLGLMVECCIFAIYCVVAIVFVFSFNTSPFYLGYGDDTSIYKQMGLTIINGAIPYVDLYDNKGLLFYLFYAFGLWLNSQWGVCLLQGMFLFCTLLVWRRLLKTFLLGEPHCFVSILLTLFSYLIFYQGGGYTEEFCLLFVSIPLMFFFESYQKQRDISFVQYFVVGVCFGVILFVRVNNAFPFVAFFIVDIIINLKSKQYNKVIVKLVSALFGVSVVTVVTVAVMLAIGGVAGLHDMFYWMFGVNFEKLVFHTNNSWSLKVFARLSVAVLFFCLSVFLFKKWNTLVFVSILLSQIPSVVSFCLRAYPHYLGILIPLYLIVVGCLVKRQKWLCFMLYFLLLIGNGDTYYYQIIRARRELVLGRVWWEDSFDKFHHYIDGLSEFDKQRIFVFDAFVGLSLLNREGIVQCNRNTLTGVQEEFDDLILSADTNVLPRWLLVTNDNGFSESGKSFVLQHYKTVVPIGEVMYENVILLGLDNTAINGDAYVGVSTVK